MKAKLTFITLFLLALSMPTAAHSGRTDSSGGHNCSQKSINKGLCTGYHYHYHDQKGHDVDLGGSDELATIIIDGTDSAVTHQHDSHTHETSPTDQVDS
jgi:hypothetical protein